MKNFNLIKRMTIDELAEFIYEIKIKGNSKTVRGEFVLNEVESIKEWLDRKTQITNREKEIICALAENNLSVSKAASNLFLHRNTVLYHIAEIKRVTGLDPLDFYELQKLMERECK